jgi:cell division protein FtsI/penicillin-binding protein 2
LPGVRVAGKTGTLKPSDSDGAASWFVGFAPSRAPRVAVSVLLDNGPVWRRKAAEVARDVLRSYFAARGARGIETPTELARR